MSPKSMPYHGKAGSLILNNGASKSTIGERQLQTPKRSSVKGVHPQALDFDEEPELVCREKEIDPSVEDEIKDGFFELRQKFKESGESSIYISHIVLHEKHPIFSKMDVETLKTLLTESSIIYLAKD
jgi:hypothetical protein